MNVEEFTDELARNLSHLVTISTRDGRLGT